MFDTNQQNCPLAEQAACFVYDEMNGENKIAFETHLQSCAACAEEIAGFAAVRASIADWRSLEFDTLSTPAVKIDFARSNQPQTAKTASFKESSWLDELRGIFTLSPAFFATVALLFLTAVCAGLIVYNYGGGQQIADAGNAENNRQTNVLAAANANQAIESNDANNKNEKRFAADNSPVLNTADDKNVAPQTARGKSSEREVVKATNAARPKAKNRTDARKNYASPTIRKTFDSSASVARNDAPVKKRIVPKLSNIDDDDADDASLRLTDLLDEAGGK